MRTGMMTRGYLTNPEEERKVDTIDNIKMNEDVKNIIKLANQQRRKDVINVIRHNDFSFSYSNEAKLKLFSENIEENKALDLNYQIKVLLKTVNDEDEKECLKTEFAELKNDYEKENFIDCILAKSCE